MAEPSERALIEEIREGSAAAFEDLMKTYEALVYRASFYYTGNRDDALDVTQEVFVKAYRRIESFTGSGSFKAWLLRITHNESLNWIRGRARHGEHEELTAVNSTDMAPVQEAEMVSRQSRERLVEAISRLNPKQQKAIALRYFERMPVSEIAANLGCTEGHARNILFRGLRRLRDELPVNWRES